ncbi:uncharacterized protein LOC116766363 [Danaus plexippus]|uniref:uncharacterized protein LOC116766363 n=1 Tax=Danaus plexippus TaxID=13037 RepID=UPI002AB2BD64|nr:uncharacterized protein LOC116766363 [Danaus plexippus]
MFRFVLLLSAMTIAVIAHPTRMVPPSEMALILGEEEFEDYLDKYLAIEQKNWINATSSPRSGCTLRVNGDFGQPQPVYINRRTNNYLAASGNSGQIRLGGGEEVIVSCPNNQAIRHPNIVSTVHTATARCVSNNLFSGAGWLNGNRAFGQLTCAGHAFYQAQQTSTRCFNNGVVIRVGFSVNNRFYPLYQSCYNQNRMEVLYVWYNQNANNAVHQNGVGRPSWLAGGFFPGVNINNLYTQASQKRAIARLVGNALADKYVTNNQFLARGHLAAKSDYVFATGQRATFFFINAAPQWQPFNAGNWNNLELNLRARIGRAGYNTVIYSGTFGVTQLRNSNGKMVNIFLDNNRVPVPQYFYKVVYDQSRRRGTAFVSINNPHYTLAEARNLQFCTDRCRNNNAFSWINWRPDRLDLGYSFCCTISDFRRVIGHIPNFDVSNGLLS